MSIYGVGQVWLVQLSRYRLWAYVGQHEFRAYHAAWRRSIWGAILAPAALVTMARSCDVVVASPGVLAWAAWLGFALQAALLLGAAFGWGPLMARLETPSGGLSRDRYQLLMRTHWLRVAIIIAYALPRLWMLSRSAWPA